MGTHREKCGIHTRNFESFACWKDLVLVPSFWINRDWWFFNVVFGVYSLTTQKVVNDGTTQKVFGAVLPESTPFLRPQNKLNTWYSHGVVAFWDNVKGW